MDIHYNLMGIDCPTCVLSMSLVITIPLGGATLNWTKKKIVPEVVKILNNIKYSFRCYIKLLDPFNLQGTINHLICLEQEIIHKLLKRSKK